MRFMMYHVSKSRFCCTFEGHFHIHDKLYVEVEHLAYVTVFPFSSDIISYKDGAII